MTSIDEDDNAARWMALRLSGEMTPAQWRRYSAWLDARPENRRAMDRYERTLSAVEGAREEALAEEFDIQLNEAFAEHSANVGNSRTRRWMAIAASLGVFIVAGSVFASKALFQPSAMFASAVGERLTVKLDDGSTATLNTNSRISVRFSKGRRKVEVTRGEALFDVARDADRPFVVATPFATVSVTGTVFNVRANSEDTVVQVVSGLVSVSPKAGPPVAVSAGQSLRLNETGRATIGVFDPEQALAWREGKARYRERPLAEVIDDLNRYFSKPIVLADKALDALPVTGDFDVTDEESAVAAIAAAFDLAAETRGDRIILTRPASRKG
jgi:transmembrane sensor